MSVSKVTFLKHQLSYAILIHSLRQRFSSSFARCPITQTIILPIITLLILILLLQLPQQNQLIPLQNICSRDAMNQFYRMVKVILWKWVGMYKRFKSLKYTFQYLMYFCGGWIIAWCIITMLVNICHKWVSF